MTVTRPSAATTHLPPLRFPLHRIGAREFDFSRQIAVMAIINRTPDSFFDSGRTFALESAVAAALKAAEDGADWVDIGGVKFAPGPEVPLEEEIDRVIPVVSAVAQSSDVVISVDTFRPEVAAAAIAAGASVINDTTGIHDHAIAEVVADSNATLVITHSLAAPRTKLAAAPRYNDVVSEVKAFLADRVELAMRLGVDEGRLVIDPGHDLNKNTQHTLEITRRLDEIASLGLPLLAAVSNKDFIGESIGRPKQERQDATIVAATVCAMLGARIVRMHDVVSAVAAMRMTEVILGFRQPEWAVHNVGGNNT
jgi:dihydropteroate synthase